VRKISKSSPRIRKRINRGKIKYIKISLQNINSCFVAKLLRRVELVLRNKANSQYLNLAGTFSTFFSHPQLLTITFRVCSHFSISFPFQHFFQSFSLFNVFFPPVSKAAGQRGVFVFLPRCLMGDGLEYFSLRCSEVVLLSQGHIQPG